MESAKVAIITGSATGIGRACALALAKQGFCLMLNYRSKKSEVQSLQSFAIDNVKPSLRPRARKACVAGSNPPRVRDCFGHKWPRNDKQFSQLLIYQTASSKTCA